MVSTVLNKILDELNKEAPKLDYIRGMIEVLIASQSHEEKSPTFINPDGNRQYVTGVPSAAVSMSTDPEAQIMDAMARANLETVKKGMMVE